MYRHLAVGLVLSFLLLGTMSIAVADTNTGDSSGANFTYSILANGNVSGLAYGSLSLASNINSTGYPASLAANGLASTKTMTLVGGQESSRLLFVSAHESQNVNQVTRNNVTMTFTLSVQVALLGNNIKNLDLGDAPINNIGSSGWVVYKLAAGNITGYFFSNGKLLESSGNNLTFYSNQTGSYTPLISGFMSRGDALSLIHEYSVKDHENAFAYNNTTGAVTGKFLSFNVNGTDGNLSNFTSVLAGQQVFSYITSNGSGNLTSNSELPVLQSPITLAGGLFVYQNGSSIFAIHDNPSLQSKFIVYNGTVTFRLAKGLVASSFATLGQNKSYNKSELNSNLSYMANASFGFDHEVEAGHSAVAIAGSAFYGLLLVNNANLTISGNVLTVTSAKDGIASVSFVAPVGLQNMSAQEQGRLAYAISHRLIAAQLSFDFLNSAISQLTMNLNNSINVSVSASNQGRISLTLSSVNHRGANIAIFLSNQVINTSSSGTVYVYLDGAQVSISTYDGVVNSTSSVNASYAVIQENSGILLLVHIPHFSNHTLVVSSSVITTSGNSGIFGNGIYDYVGIGAVLTVIAGVSIMAIVKRKRD